MQTLNREKRAKRLALVPKASKLIETSWPHGLGDPSVSGCSSNLHYVYFPARRRLAVSNGKCVKVYDTGEGPMTGFFSRDGRMLTFEIGGARKTLRSLKLLSP